MSEGLTDITKEAFFQKYFANNVAARVIINALAKSDLSMFRIAGNGDTIAREKAREYVLIGNRLEEILPYLEQLGKLGIIGKIETGKGIPPKYYFVKERKGDIPRINPEYRKSLLDFLTNLSQQ